jgi:hypothetical protein
MRVSNMLVSLLWELDYRLAPATVLVRTESVHFFTPLQRKRPTSLPKRYPPLAQARAGAFSAEALKN